MKRVGLLATVVVLAVCVAVPTAHADGDPASDYLITQKVFFPFDVKFPAKQQADFAALVEAANRAGFKIRVALIASSYDMGSIISLYRKPRTYARFLGAELAFVYKQRLLVVMPNGFGFNWPHHPTAPAYAVLEKVPVESDPGAMLTAAQTAVQRLAASAGVTVAADLDVTTPGQRDTRDRYVILLITAGILLVLVILVPLRRRRR